MNAKEIFTKISAHQIEGMMFHNDMADYFNFLGLDGFKKMQDYRFLSETVEMRKIRKYYISRYDELLGKPDVNSESNIPKNLSGYSRQDIEEDSKQKHIKEIFEKWCKWESETKSMYEVAYSNLCNIGEVASACKIKTLIEDVDHELKESKNLYLELLSMDFDMPTIVGMQESLKGKYELKEKCIGIRT